MNQLLVNHECTQCVEVPGNRVDRYLLGSIFRKMGWDIFNDNFTIKAFEENDLKYRYKYHKLNGYKFFTVAFDEDDDEPVEYEEEDYELAEYKYVEDDDDSDDSCDSDYEDDDDEEEDDEDEVSEEEEDDDDPVKEDKKTKDSKKK